MGASPKMEGRRCLTAALRVPGLEGLDGGRLPPGPVSCCVSRFQGQMLEGAVGSRARGGPVLERGGRSEESEARSRVVIACLPP